MSHLNRTIAARGLAALTVALLLGLTCHSASAQSLSGPVGGFGGPTSLQYTPRPTLSPYLNLFTNPNAFGQYQLQVQPFLQQNQLNYQQNSAINQLQGQVSQLRSSTGFGTSGGGHLGATGEASGYMNYSHYYSGHR
jgi:hypothetical protein